MKRGGTRHPKTLNLAEELGIPRPYAVGLLEELFHFTAEFAPQGNVGKYSNKRIAAAIGWPGKADRLVECLVAAGWLEVSTDHRLVVHDWADHMDRTTAQKLIRSKKVVIQSNQQDSGKVCTQSETSGFNLDTLPLPEPMPEPMPEPEPRPKPAARPLPEVALAPPSSGQASAYGVASDRVLPLPSWHLDDTYRPIVEEAKDFWPDSMDQDFSEAYLEWRRLTLIERIEATRNLRDKQATEPGSGRFVCKNFSRYLGGSDWKRKARPKPLSELDRMAERISEKQRIAVGAAR